MAEWENVMHRWPDFFIVGTGRAGTTSLYYYLRGHPSIYMSSVKEPHFFSTIDAGPPDASGGRQRHRSSGVISREQDYTKLFGGVLQNQLAGEASTSYLSDKNAADRIQQKVPQAKIIGVLRKPTDRAYSQYLLDLREGRERCPSFYEALRQDYQGMVKYQGSGSFYIWPGLYHQHLSRFLDTFGSAQVRIFLYEDLEHDTTTLVKELCCFLGVPYYDGSFFDPNHKYHTYGTPRNALFRWVGRSRSVRSLAAAIAPMHLLIPLRDQLVDRQRAKPPLDPRARDFLRSIYHDEILKLQALIRRDLSGWLF
jgi:hypothetical protein